MTLTQIEKFLRERPGYLQWSDVRIALKLNTDIELVSKAKSNVKNNIDQPSINLPRILVLDIETAPIQAYVWGMWKQNLSLDSIESDWFMISWAAKWLGEPYVLGEVLEEKEIKNEDDERIVKSLWKVLESADIVITHNGDKFDIKRINSRFIEHNLGPVSPYKSIDTLKVVKKNFDFSSNKLEALARKFGYEGKYSTGFKLWVRCLKGDKKALEDMLSYNKQDVCILEKVYYKLRPWIKNHPNLGLYIIDDDIKCPVCGKINLEDIRPETSTVSKYKSFRCSNCGAISRERSTMLTRDENKKIITNAK